MSHSMMDGARAKEESSFSSLRGLRWLQLRCGEIVDDERCQMFILLLITVNSIMIGMQTFPAIKNNPDIYNSFEAVDLFVLLVFTVESAMQLFFHGFREFFSDGWLIFDLVIVAISWVSMEYKALEAFRAFRALRFVTRVAVLRNVVVALVSIVPAITAIFTLLLLIFFIFAVMFTQLFKNLYEEGHTQADYFGRMDYTLFTLFQVLCLDEWSGMAYEVQEVYCWAWALFIVFIVMTAFVVVNLLIAVICDALQILRTAEEAMLEQNLYAQEPQLEVEKSDGGDDLDEMTNEKMRQRIGEMQRLLDEMVETQESMARTIQHLAVALHSKKTVEKLGSINEGSTFDESFGNGDSGVEVLTSKNESQDSSCR